MKKRYKKKLDRLRQHINYLIKKENTKEKLRKARADNTSVWTLTFTKVWVKKLCYIAIFMIVWYLCILVPLSPYIGLSDTVMNDVKEFITTYTCGTLLVFVGYMAKALWETHLEAVDNLIQNNTEIEEGELYNGNGTDD